MDFLVAKISFVLTEQRAVMQMARTINGEVLIDDYGNFNEQVWLENAIAVYALLLGEEKDGDENEHRH